MPFPQTIHIGYENRSKRFTFTSDKDCLSPQINNYTARHVTSLDVLHYHARELERRGYRVSINTDECFYESQKKQGRNLNGRTNGNKAG